MGLAELDSVGRMKMNYTVDISRQVRDAFREQYQLTERTVELLERSLAAQTDLDLELGIISEVEALERRQLTDDNTTLLLEHALFIHEARCRKQIEASQRIRQIEADRSGEWWS